MKILLGEWSSLADGASAIRYAVFVEEQGVPRALELDDMDELCLHALVMDETGRALATGRLLPDGHIGRVAVQADARGQGVGRLLMQALMREARSRGHACVVVHAQCSAESFYASLGFATCSDIFEEAGIQHVTMQCRL